jgi:hypothetical protein
LRGPLRAAVGLPVIAALLCGCGSTTPIVSHVTLRTQAGVRYAVEVRISGGRACTFQTYTVIAAHVKPFTKTTRSCGHGNGLVGPLLIQVARPATALILDRPLHGCATARITYGRGRSIVAETTCSATKPTLRLTALPRATSFAVAGIAGVTRLVLHDYPCSAVCSRPLAVSH